MLKFLLTAAKAAGLAYQLATTVVLLGALFAGKQHVSGGRRKAG